MEPFERIVDFAVIDRDFDAKQGELTPKGTFKRTVIENNFKEVIELLYRRTTMTVGEVKVTVPNWLFQKLGITTSNLRVENDSLRMTATGTSLTLRKHAGDRIQVGSVLYRFSRGPVNLSVLLRTPSLWLGNEELVRFAPLELRHRDRRRQLSENIEWYRRTGFYDATGEDRQSVEELLSKKELGLMDMHRVATLLEAKEPADGILALRVIEHCLGLEDTNVTAVARRILRRARFSPHPEVLRRAFQILAFFEQPRLYRQMLDAFLAGPEQVLDSETIAVLSERDLAQERLDAFMSVAEERVTLAEAIVGGSSDRESAPRFSFRVRLHSSQSVHRAARFSDPHVHGCREHGGRETCVPEPGESSNRDSGFGSGRLLGSPSIRKPGWSTVGRMWSSSRKTSTKKHGSVFLRRSS